MLWQMILHSTSLTIAASLLLRAPRTNLGQQGAALDRLKVARCTK